MGVIELALLALLAAAQPPHVEITVDAEQYATQEKDSVRRWHLLTATHPAPAGVDATFHPGAWDNAYMKVLPDTRRTHADKLIAGENFSNTPGELAVLNYRVNFPSAGRYFVWVRAYSTGSEDNGIHVGLDGEWPESGRRMQWCEGKDTWRWESKQRTEANHCGEPGKIYLDVPSAGWRRVSFSMREDGFEFDRFTLTTNPNFTPRAR